VHRRDVQSIAEKVIFSEAFIAIIHLIFNGAERKRSCIPTTLVDTVKETKHFRYHLSLGFCYKMADAM
jgi:hypothetical protein